MDFGRVTCRVNGLEECRLVTDEQVLYKQARKLKDAREAIKEKLEDYKQQYEQMELRAVAAEMEVTSLKLHTGDLEGRLLQYEQVVRKLTEKLSSQSKTSSDNFEKLKQLRAALVKEVSKLRQSATDMHLAVTAMQQCVLEYRDNAVSKEDFLNTMNLILSTVKKESTPTHSVLQSVFDETERKRLSLLSNSLRKSRLAELMGALGEQIVCEHSSTDKALQSPSTKHPKDSLFRKLTKKASLKMLGLPKSPPIPPRERSLASSASSSSTNAGSSPRSPLKPPAKPPKPRSPRKRVPFHHSNTVQCFSKGLPSSPYSPVSNSLSNPVAIGEGVYSAAGRANSDSDSDFELFTPPQVRKKRIQSETVHSPCSETVRSPCSETVRSPVQWTVSRRPRRGSSPCPGKASSPSPVPILTEPDQQSKEGAGEEGNLPKHSPVLTERPTWLQKKFSLQDLPSRRQARIKDARKNFKVRSRSLDAVALLTVKGGSDVEDYITSGYSKPFEHIESWRNYLGLQGDENSKALNHSLSGVGSESVKTREQADSLEDSVGCTYLDPREINNYYGPQRKHSLGSMYFEGPVNATYLKVLYGNPKVDKTVATKQDQDELDNHSPGSSNVQDPVGSLTPDLCASVNERLNDDAYQHMTSGSFDTVDRWRQNFEYLEMPESCHSGYTSDTSSVDWALSQNDISDRNPYDVIPGTGSRLADNDSLERYPRQFPNGKSDDIYCAIDEFSTVEKLSHSSPEARCSPEVPARATPDPQLQREDGYCSLTDNLDGVEFTLGGPTLKRSRPPTLPPRPLRKLSSLNPPVQRDSMDRQKLVAGIGKTPLYQTQKRSQNQLQAFPVSNASSSDEHALSDSELPAPSQPVPVPSSSNAATTTSSSLPRHHLHHSECAPGYKIPKRRVTAAATPLSGHVIQQLQEESGDEPSAQRSHTFSIPSRGIILEKSGYLNSKIAPKQKHWTKRWFILKGSELKYYRTREYFFGYKRPKGLVNLALCCQLSRHETTEGMFELSTAKRTYLLAASTAQECDEWITALEQAMRLHLMAGERQSKAVVQVQKSPMVAGWAHVSQSGCSQKTWVALEGDSLTFATKPGLKPHHSIGMGKSSVHKRPDSLLQDSNQSSSRLNSILLTITEGDHKVTHIAPENQKDKDTWFYEFQARQGGESRQSCLERKLAVILQEGGEREHDLWKHPVFKCTSVPLREPQISLPSATLVTQAQKLFHSVQLFMTTPIDPVALDYHICSVQHMMSTCLRHAPLQDELYCQLLRQLTGHTSTSSNVLQGWFLLYLLIPIFLPVNRMFQWYLDVFLVRSADSSSPVAGCARQCQDLVRAAKESGPRLCKSSRMELMTLLSRCTSSPATLDPTMSLPVYLPDGSSVELSFTPLTSVEGFVAELNDELGLPGPAVTGFSLMCDWPGAEEQACYHPSPQDKLADVISLWSSAMEKLNQVPSAQRTITLSYKKRLSFRQHHGDETEKEAILLAYQTSKEVFSGRHPVLNAEQGVQMAAVMAQIEHGDWAAMMKENKNSGIIAREALQRFCPWRYTHLALEHDNSLMQKRLVEQWAKQAGKTQRECTGVYLTLAQQWKYYGATLFHAENQNTHSKNHFLWLAVHEDGVSFLEQSTMVCLHSYCYSEVATFGEHGDDFMLVVSPRRSSTSRQKPSHATTVQAEKILLSMSKLKVREATFLIASYLEKFEPPHLDSQ